MEFLINYLLGIAKIFGFRGNRLLKGDPPPGGGVTAAAVTNLRSFSRQIYKSSAIFRAFRRFVTAAAVTIGFEGLKTLHSIVTILHFSDTRIKGSRAPEVQRSFDLSCNILALV